MNIGPLFNRYHELADAPERIPALRKVILAYLLHSAVNSPDAISRAATLREAHEVRRRELIKKASRKDVPTVRAVSDEDLPPSLSDIPTVLFDRLGNIASIEKGLSQIQSTKPGKYPLVVTAETRSSSESFDFEGAAAIIPLVSSTGHGDASLKRLHYQEGRYAVGNILAVVKPICPDLLRARFIYEYLSAFKEELLVSRMVGTANVSLTVNKLKEVPVPLVSGPMLSRIDELMAMCDRLEAQLQERDARQAELARASLARFAEDPTPENLQFLFHSSFSISPADLRKTILTLAVQGKLVPQDPNDEPAEEIVRRAESERSKSAPDGGRIPIEEKERPWTLPFSWEWVRLGNLANIKHGFAFSSDSFTSVPTSYVLTTPGNFHESGGFRDRGANTKYFNGEVPPAFVFNAGDLIIPMTEQAAGLLGSPAFIPNDGKTYLHNQRLGKLEFYSHDVAPEYVFCFFNNQFFRDELARTCTGMKVRHTSPKRILKVPFALPPLAEQRRIVAKVEELMTLVDTLEIQLATARTTAADLLAAAVAELSFR